MIIKLKKNNLQNENTIHNDNITLKSTRLQLLHSDNPEPNLQATTWNLNNQEIEAMAHPHGTRKFNHHKWA